MAAFDEFLSHRVANKVSELARLYRCYDPDIEGQKPLAPQPESLKRLTEASLAFFERAGFRKLGWNEIHASSSIATPQGINLLVMPELYEASMVMVLPPYQGTRKHRPWWRLFFKRVYKVDLYPRVILLLKPDPTRFKEPDLDTEHVFLRLFRNVPVHDLEMIFPGGRVKLTYFDRIMILYPLIAGFGLLLYQIIPELMKKPVPNLLTNAVLAVGFYALFKWTVAMALGGWSWRTYSAYRGKMERYGLKLTRNLYLQTMDSNLGVFTRLGADIAQRDREFLWYLTRENGMHNLVNASAESIRETARKVAGTHFQGNQALETLVEELISQREIFKRRPVKKVEGE